jgi:hypothetical protein
MHRGPLTVTCTRDRVAGDIAVEVDLFDEVKGSSVVDIQFSLAAPGEELLASAEKTTP